MKSRIIFLVPSLNIGGMQKVVVLLANKLSENIDNSVEIVLYGRNLNLELTTSQNVKIIETKIRKSKVNKLLFYFISFIQLRRIVSRADTSVIFSFGEIWNGLVLLFFHRMKLNIYVMDRCSPSKHLGFWNELIRKYTYPRADGLIVQTTSALNIYRKNNFNSNIIHIPNPVASNDNLNISNENIILNVGRMIPSKNQLRLIRIFQNLNRPNWRLVLVGGKEAGSGYFDEVKAYVTTHGLTNVVLVGEQNEVGVECYYRRAKVFAFTSESEGFPNVILESLSYGVPVVSYNCKYGPEDLIVDGFNGYLVEMFDDIVFAKRLLNVMDNMELLSVMRLNAIASVKKYKPSTIALRYKRLAI